MAEDFVIRNPYQWPIRVPLKGIQSGNGAIIVWSQTTPFAAIVAQLDALPPTQGALVYMVDDGTGNPFVMNSAATNLNRVQFVGLQWALRNVKLVGTGGTLQLQRDFFLQMDGGSIAVAGGGVPVFSSSPITLTARFSDGVTVTGAGGVYAFSLGKHAIANVSLFGESTFGTLAFDGNNDFATVNYSIDATSLPISATAFSGSIVANETLVGTLNTILLWTPTASSASWPALYQQIQHAAAIGQGVVVQLLDDNSFNTWLIPAGNYNLDNVTFEALAPDGAGFGFLEFAAGMTITGRTLVLQGITLGTHGNHFTGGDFNATLLDQSYISLQSGASPFVITAGGQNGLGLEIVGGGGLQNGSDPGVAVFSLSAGTFGFGVFSGAVVLNANAIKAVSGNPGFNFVYDTTAWIDPAAFDTAIAATDLYDGARNNLVNAAGAVVLTRMQLAGMSGVQVTATANITALTLPAPNQIGSRDEGRRLTLYLKQNAAGTATWPGTIGNVKLPGGVFAKTTTANAVDKLELQAINGAWWANVASDVK